ncbi:MAG: hypothetical protein U5J63_04680 [Fodinibius sp.]|nr:hypothetical protein [Fodinibius sp.]
MGRAFSISPAVSSLAISGGTAEMAAGIVCLCVLGRSLAAKAVNDGLYVRYCLVDHVCRRWSPNFAMLVVVNFLKGMAISGISAVALAYLAEEVQGNVLGFIISIYMSGNILGGMSGRVGAGFLNGWLGWRYTAR